MTDTDEETIHPWTKKPAPDNLAIATAAHQADLAAQAAQDAWTTKREASEALGYTGNVNLDPSHAINSAINTNASWGFPTGNVPTEGTQAHWDSMGNPDRPNMMTQEQRQWGADNCVGSGCREFKGTPVTSSEWARKNPRQMPTEFMFPVMDGPPVVKHGTQNFWESRGKKPTPKTPFLNPYSTQELHNIMPERKYDKYGQIVGNPEIKKAQAVATPEYKLRQQKTQAGFRARKRKKKKEEKGFGFDVPW